MFNVIQNNSLPMDRVLSTTTTLEEFTNFVDSLSEGMHWVYLTRQTVQSFTGVSGLLWGNVTIYKKISPAPEVVICELRTGTPESDVYILRKDGEWDEQFIPRNLR